MLVRNFMAVLTASILLAACGGGGGSTSPSTPTTPGAVVPPSSVSKGTASFSFRIPAPGASAATSKARTPQYISPSTTGVLINLETVNGAAPAQKNNYYFSTSSCTVNPDNSKSCTFLATEPVGMDTFDILLYGIGANGPDALSYAGGVVNGTIVVTGNSLVPVTLYAVVGGMGQATFNKDGSTGYLTSISYPFYDMANNLLPTPMAGVYANTVTITDSDASGATSLSVVGGHPETGTTVHLWSPAESVTVNYSKVTSPVNLTITNSVGAFSVGSEFENELGGPYINGTDGGSGTATVSCTSSGCVGSGTGQFLLQ
ncbi:MAG: hypothetical protein JWN27_585 [Candidatus Eremiobacteraeota bacterium]|nr:hypothetical protein [Candidatus Eremiobacteraeota bacterium]